MKFTLRVKNTKTGNEFNESYDERVVKDQETGEKWGRDIVAYYNRTLRPGESPREFISVTLEGASDGHQWEKDLTKMSAGGFDGFYCTKCKITGKRFGLNSVIKIDPKFKKKVFQTCTLSTAVEVQKLNDFR
jgi:hypothetical protein